MLDLVVLGKIVEVYARGKEIGAAEEKAAGGKKEGERERNVVDLAQGLDELGEGDVLPGVVTA